MPDPIHWERGFDLYHRRYDIVGKFLKIWSDKGELVVSFNLDEWDYKISKDGETELYVLFKRKGTHEDKRESGDPQAYKRWLENDRERERDTIQDRRINDPYEAWSR